MAKNTESAENENLEEGNNTKINAESNEEIKQAVAEPKEEPSLAKGTLAQKPNQGRFRRFIGTKKGKVISIITAATILLVVLFAVPMTRYGILGTFIKKNVKISVTDSATQKPVSEATITLGTVTGKTDGNGTANLSNVPVGDHTLKVTKNYYKTAEALYTVPVIANPQDTSLEIAATGRQVVVNLVDTVTKDPLAKAIVNVKNTSAVTDNKGNATIVLPADKKTLKGTAKLDGYNQADVEIKVTEQADANKFTLTPSGNIYYLSKQTGKINVMKSNLDGTDAKVVVEGTGNENDRSTVLLAARDWKYLALSANRSGSSKEQIYLVDTVSGKLALMDEGDASFQLVGWSGHKFIYSLIRNGKNSWDDKRQALKSFNAETGKLAIVDETAGIGSNFYDMQSEEILNPYIVEGKLVYVKSWILGSNFTYASSDKKSVIVVVNLNNDQKQTVKEFPVQHSIAVQAKLYEPQEIYFRVTIDGSAPAFYEYEGDSVKSVSNTDEKFYNTFYPTYLVSPTGEKTFWSEPRDGKNALFVGDKNGSNSKELALQSEYKAYGWYSDKYILLSKNGSELFIAPSDKPLGEAVKITNYHKPDVTFPGYGYGYGGQ